MEGTVYRPLFDFDAVVDIPLSIAKLIKEEYWSSKYFINLNNEKFLKCLFLSISDRNPVKYLVTDKYVDRCDDLYEELRNDPKLKEYYSVYHVGRLIDVFNASGFTRSTVLVKNKSDMEYIKNLYEKNVELLFWDRPIDINGKYGMYYTSNIYNLVDNFIEPKFINFRILDLKCNMEQKSGFELFKLDVLSKISDTNNLAIIKPYNDIAIPEEV